MHRVCGAAWVQVPAEIAAMVRRRTLSLVEIPAALAAAMEDAMRAGTRASSKQQRLESQQLLGTLRQLSRSRSRGGSNVLPDTDAAMPAPVPRVRGSRARGDEVSTMPGPRSCTSPRCLQSCEALRCLRLLSPPASKCEFVPRPGDLYAEAYLVRLQRQQWRQTKRQLLQTGMLDLPASAKAAGRRTRNGAAAAGLTDETDSEAEDELDSDPQEGEDRSALTEAFRDAAPKGALLSVVLRKRGPTCTRSMRLSREALSSQRCPALQRLAHLHRWAGQLLGAVWEPSQSRGAAPASRLLSPQAGSQAWRGVPAATTPTLSRLAEAVGDAPPAVALPGRVRGR